MQPFPPYNANAFRKWHTQLRKDIAGFSGRPIQAFAWWSTIDKATSYEELANEDPEFETFSYRVAAVLSSMLSGELQRQIGVLEERLNMEGQMFNAKQLAWLVYQRYRRTDAEASVQTHFDLIGVQIKGNNLWKFVNDL